MGRTKYCLVVVLLVQIFFERGTQGKIEDWERSCVVGECVRSSQPFRSCSVQPLDIRLQHPGYTDLQSEPAFRNRRTAVAVESCGGRPETGQFIPLCCPDSKTEEAMVIGGLSANSHEFPHQVRLLVRMSTGRKQKCGGTIYSKDYVLTAASCLTQDQGATVHPSDVQVIIGQNLEHQRIPQNIISVADIKVHERFRPTIHTYGIDNDIALLRLRTPLDLTTTRVKALKIPNSSFRAQGRNAIIVGWGKTSPDAKSIGSLLKMNSHINSENECVRKSIEALRQPMASLLTSEERARSSFDDIGFGDSSFDRSRGSYSSSRSSSSSSRSSFGSGSSFDTGFGNSRSGGRGRPSLFENDDFFNWGRRSSLSDWEAKHEFVNMGDLNLGKMWEGGIHRRSRQPHLEPISSLPSSLLCIGGDGKGFSRGDSGGPAICEGPDGSPILCGISSFGRNEFGGKWPATYVNVAHYADWIKSSTGGRLQHDGEVIKEVIDGEPIAGAGEASFFIRIRNKKTNMTCGGALINSQTVLSSSSCVPTDVRTDDLQVTSGQLMDGNRGVDHEVDGVATRETYKNYRSKLRGRSRHTQSELKGDFPQLNLAVLKLYRPVRDVKPIPLISSNMGRTLTYEYGWRNDNRDKSLNRWAYKEVPLEECKARYKTVGIEVDEAHLCATETYSGGELCNKELGNPLVCKDRSGARFLCGVTGIRDCTYSFPTVFTNLVHNLDWVQL